MMNINVEMTTIFFYMGLCLFSLWFVWRNFQKKSYQMLTLWLLLFVTLVAITIDKAYGINYVLYPLTALISYRILLIFIGNDKDIEKNRVQEEN